MSLMKKLPFFQSDDLLVCATDGFSLKGIVYTRLGDEVNVLHEIKVDNTDMAEALAELMTELKQQQCQVKQAVVLSPAVLSTIVELPVNPKKPRKLAQMSELVHWEVEPLLMQHMTRWSVGHLLVGQGYMNEDQAQAVMDLQQGKANPAGGVELSEKYSFRRFGELAEELGYIRSSQLKACLAGQEWLKGEEDKIVCGWTGQAEVADVPGMFYWSVSAVSESLLMRWKGLFAKHHLQLQAMYPLMGMTACQLTDSNERENVIEIHRGMSMMMMFEHGFLVNQTLSFHSQETQLHSCIDLINNAEQHSSQLSLHFCQDEPDELNEQLILHVDQNVQNTVKDADYHLEAAAKNAFGFKQAQLIPEVREGGPLPPVTQRAEVRGGLLGGILLVFIIMAELTLAVRYAQVSAFKDDVDERWAVIDTATKAVTERNNKIEAQKAALEEQRQAEQHADAMLRFYTEELPKRNAIVRGLLGTLQQTTPDDVIIVSIDELGKRATFFPDPKAKLALQPKTVEVENFNITAWALTEASAQSFIQDMKHAVKQLGLTVLDPVVKEGAGPIGLDGYTLVI
jgi:hypothetical protein